MGHSFTSGRDLPLVVLLPVLPVTAGCAWLAARSRRGPLAIGLGLLAMQGALHLFFAGVQGHTTTPPAGSNHTTTGAVDHMGTAVSADATLLGQSSLAMVAAHLAAAAFCALWLAHGERAFFRLAAAATALAFTPLRLLLTVVPLPENPRPVPVRRPPAIPRTALLLGHTLVRRGPPAVLVPRATAPGAAI